MNNWWNQAVCKNMPKDLFFPSPGESVREPLMICDSCPVKNECLNYALENFIIHGVWGGTTGRERREMLKHVPRPPTKPDCGTNAGYTYHRRYDRLPVTCSACRHAHNFYSGEKHRAYRASQSL